MMRVVVVHAHPIGFTLEFEPASNAAVEGKAFSQSIGLEPEGETSGERRPRVENIVTTEYLKGHRVFSRFAVRIVGQESSWFCHECCTGSRQRNASNPKVCDLALAVRHHFDALRPCVSSQAKGSGIVSTCDEPPTWGDAGGEALERGVHRCLVTPMVEVIRFDVGDDGNVGTQD
jgi:hypothetical protein